LNRRADIEIRTVYKQVQEIREIDRGIRERLVLKLELAKAGRCELLRGDFSQRLDVAAEKVEPQLLQRHAIDAGELHLQQNLPRLRGGRNLQQIDHFLRSRRSQAFDALHLGGVLYGAGENDRFPAAAQQHSGRQACLQLFARALGLAIVIRNTDIESGRS